MTNTEIESMLTTIAKTVNTLRTVTSNIDELLGLSHVFITQRSPYSRDKYTIMYEWKDPNAMPGINPNRILLYIHIETNLDVRAEFFHPLLLGTHQSLRTTLDAKDLNQKLLLLVGQCCHRPTSVCPFCGL